jgi:hypothetical protein
VPQLHPVYDRPLAHGVNFTALGNGAPCAVNAGWGWNWKGRERATGRERTYYTRTSFGSKADLAAHVEEVMPGIEFIDAGPADRAPAIVMPLPPHSFQRGVLEIVQRELQGDVRTRSPLRTLTRVRLPHRR